MSSYRPGQVIQVDVGAFVASPCMQGEWRDAEFLGGPNGAGQVYVRQLPNGHPLWVWTTWTRSKS